MGRTSATEAFAVAFGERVRSQRTKRKWTQERLAEKVGLHFTYISSIERGERNVSLKNILRIAEALDVGPDVLVKGLRSDAV